MHVPLERYTLVIEYAVKTTVVAREASLCYMVNFKSPAMVRILTSYCLLLGHYNLNCSLQNQQ